MAVLDTSGKEVFYEVNTNSLVGNTSVAFLYPPDLYNNGGEVLSSYVARPADQIKNVDIGFLRLKVFEDSTQNDAHNNGDFGSTNIGGAFYAVDPDDYFYKYDGLGATLDAPLLERAPRIPTIGESVAIPADSTGVTFENKSLSMATANVCRFDDLEVDGLNEGYKATAMPALAIRLETEYVEDVAYRCFDASTVTGASTTITNTKVITDQVDGTVDVAITHFDGVDADLVDEPVNDFVDENANYTAPGVDYVSAVEIVNVERELDDDRYGDVEDDLPFFFTGASHVFTDAELVDVAAKTPVYVDFSVYGGDCYIGLHTFKITDSTYSLTDPEKLIDGTGTPDNETDAIDKWEYYFDKTSGTGTKENMSRPYPLKGASQTITVLLESEINPEVAEKPPHNQYLYDVTTGLPSTNGNLPVPTVDDAGQIRSTFKYRYNLDYSKENDYKIFLPYQSFDKNVNEFGARVLYSDQKVYNSDVEGFDRFRALNFYDLDESNGSATNIIESGDKLFVLQESTVSYLPIQAQILETSDGSNVSVRSGEIIGIPIKIDTEYGTQHPRSVKVDSNSFFFVDKRNGEVCMFDGKQVQLISRNGMEQYFTAALAGVTTHSDIHAIYDRKKKEYIVYARGSDSAVFNAIRGTWTGRYPEAAATSTLGGVMIDDTMMVIGIGAANDLDVGNIYGSGTMGSFWGTQFTPSFKFLVNPEPEMAKTFDQFSLVSTLIPDPQGFVVIKDDGSLSSVDLSSAVITYREGTFRIKNLRDGNGARARGLYGEFEIDLGIASQSGISSAVTKYRTSYKPI